MRVTPGIDARDQPEYRTRGSAARANPSAASCVRCACPRPKGPSYVVVTVSACVSSEQVSSSHSSAYHRFRVNRRFQEKIGDSRRSHPPHGAPYYATRTARNARALRRTYFWTRDLPTRARGDRVRALSRPLSSSTAAPYFENGGRRHHHRLKNHRGLDSSDPLALARSWSRAERFSTANDCGVSPDVVRAQTGVSSRSRVPLARR